LSSLSTETFYRSHVHAPSVADLLERPGSLLTSTHLAELGLSRKAIDAVWRACPVVILPGYRRPMVRVEDFSSSSPGPSTTTTAFGRPGRGRPKAENYGRARAC
jgi:hypothetical protein